MTFEQVKESALNLLTRREYGAYELKQRLLLKGYEQTMIDDVIGLFIASGLQSDERFVDNYVRRRLAKFFGPIHIAQSLRRLRINPTLIQDVLANYEMVSQESLMMLWSNKFGSNLAQEPKLKSKQLRFMQSRGFELSQVLAFLEENNDECK
jgi:regulatory protein